MPAVAPYIPPKDADFNNWLNNFDTLILAAPMLYGLTALNAALIDSVTQAWNAAYLLVTSKSTKTAQAVSNKNTARINAQVTVRPFAQAVSLNPGVSGANKIALGLNPRTSTPAPVTPPTTNPVLTVQSASANSLILRYRDSAASVSVKSKPFGVTQLRLYGKASATPITDPTTLPLIATPTKSPFVLLLGGFTPASQLYLAGQWAIRTGGVGPFSSIINFTVPVGS